jgi:predicted phage-related endonuclease
MPIERWTITDREEWLARRKPNINGSEVGALFGCSPFLTPFALFADKAGLAELPMIDSDVLERGQILEPSIPPAVLRERPDWKIEKATDYLWSPEWRLGCTPDFYAYCPHRGKGVLQGKTVAGPEFDEKWQNGPPKWILLQTLLEGMLSECSWAAIGVLIIRNAYKLERAVFEFERHPGAEAKIVAEAARFWADVEADRPPAPNYAMDGDTIKALFPHDDGPAIDLSQDNRMPELLDRYETLSAMNGHAEKELKAIKTEIAAKLGAAAVATLPGWQVTHKLQTRKETLIKETSFRVLRIKRVGQQQEQAA